MAVSLTVRHESWPIAGTFAISRGSRTAVDVITVELVQNGARGWAECVPYPHYGETVESVIEAIEALRTRLHEGLGRDELQELPAGAARNGVDCALWDLEAARSDDAVWQLAGLQRPGVLTTAYTLSLDTPDNMAAAARRNAARPLLKLKLSGEGDLERVGAVREAAPEAQLILDANEGWTADLVEPYSAALSPFGISLIEQPLPAAEDGMLADIEHPVPLCADESCHTTADLDDLAARYDAVNIKLDKTGGLTEALALYQAARAAGLQVMVGCMLATSLSMAPALLVAQEADFVDLDGPLLLARDRDPCLRYEGSAVYPPEALLWG